MKRRFRAGGQGPGRRQARARLLGLLQPGPGLLGQVGGGLEQRILRHGLGQEIGQLEIGEAEQLDRLLLGGGQPGGEPLHLPRRCMLTEAGAELHHSLNLEAEAFAQIDAANILVA